MLSVAVTIASGSNPLPVSYLNQLNLCMSRLLKTLYTWPHIFQQTIFIPKFRYQKGVSTTPSTRLQRIVRQSPSTCQTHWHSRMAPISILVTGNQRITLFFPTKAMTSYLRPVPPAAVLAWSTVMSGTNNGWTRTLILYRSLFCQVHQIMMRQRHSLATCTTTSWCMLKSLVRRRAPLIWRWRWQMTGLVPYIFQIITTPITLIIITDRLS